MKKLYSLVIFIPFLLIGQTSDIWTIFDQQIHAFNNRDLTQLVTNISDDFKWIAISADTVLTELAGKENFKKSMVAYFKSQPHVRSTIDSYNIHNNRISFKETVTYTNKAGKTLKSSALGVYEIANGKIRRAWYFY